MTWFCFFASYLLAAALEIARLWHKGALFRWTALGFGFAGFLAHTAYLLERARMVELPPLLSSGHDWLLVLAWLAVLMYLFVSLLDRSAGFGLFLLPIVVLVVGAARFVSTTTDATLNAQRGWGMLHAAMWVLGAAGVIVGLVLSVMYLIQHRRLRQKANLHAGVELPSLERLGRLNWWAVVVSVPLLTIGMVTGVGLALMGEGEVESVQLTQPGIVISAVVWLAMMALFVWLLVARRTPGRLVAWRTVWAAGFLLVTLIVLQVFSRGGVHGTAASGSLCNPFRVDLIGFTEHPGCAPCGRDPGLGSQALSGQKLLSAVRFQRTRNCGVWERDRWPPPSFPRRRESSRRGGSPVAGCPPSRA